MVAFSTQHSEQSPGTLGLCEGDKCEDGATQEL